MDVFQYCRDEFLETLAVSVVNFVYEYPIARTAFTVVSRHVIRVSFGVFDGACESLSDGEAVGGRFGNFLFVDFRHDSLQS